MRALLWLIAVVVVMYCARGRVRDGSSLGALSQGATTVCQVVVVVVGAAVDYAAVDGIAELLPLFFSITTIRVLLECSC